MKKIVSLAILGILTATFVYAQQMPSREAILIDKLLNEIAGLKAQVVPAGAILSFDMEKCPDGWREYLPASGRFIVGAGGGRDKNGTEKDFGRGVPRKDQDGEYTHTLSIGEMPSHTHRLNRTKGKNGDGHFPDWS